ncbi:MAG TPA: hypothetical protein VK034_07295, partial [Enhygromyxa sp.]|nr:hypothetical protein [Enhygromyxa sp.]
MRPRASVIVPLLFSLSCKSVEPEDQPAASKLEPAASEPTDTVAPPPEQPDPTVSQAAATLADGLDRAAFE